MRLWNRLLRGLSAAALLMAPALLQGQGTTVCGTTEWALTAGQTIPVGTLTVANDSTNLYVTYTLDPNNPVNATFGTLHLWVGSDLTTLPATQNGPNAGTPIPGQFPNVVDATGLSTYTFTIPFINLGIQDVSTACGNPLYVVAHAEVGDQTAFGGDQTGAGVRWWYYGIYKVCCEVPPPPIGVCATAFAKGTHVWTTDKKSNPENLPSLKLTRNRWGWANLLTTPGTYTRTLWAGAGLNNTGSGVNVGTVTVAWDGSTATVTYALTTAGYYLKEAHLFVGDDAPTTTAPGQYGHIAYFLSHEAVYTFSVPLTDADGGGVWVVAHAVVCN